MKIGLIALSGVRANDEELTRMGLTLPGFVERSRVIAALPSLGLLTLAGMTDADVELEYIDVPDVDALGELRGDFDAVALSSFTARIRDAYRLAARYRAAGVKTVLGGIHVTLNPDEARRHADCVVLGEGELAWPQLVADLKRGALQPVYDCRGRSFDLAEAPMPRHELLDATRYNRFTVQTQRGCPFDCEFCAASIRISPRYKVKPVEKVIAEIRRIQAIQPGAFIEFADDNSFVNKPHSKRLMRALAPEGVRWFTETDISVADDPELLAMMRDAGCVQVLIGLEAPSRAGLDGLERKANWKAAQAGRYKAAIDRIQGAGISVNGCFVLGLDGAGPESFDDVFRFVRESGLREVQVTVATAFPGTPFYRRLKDAGRILQDGAWELCTLFDVNFRPSGMGVQELERRFRDLVGRLYSEDETERRKAAFRARVEAAQAA